MLVCVNPRWGEGGMYNERGGAHDRATNVISKYTRLYRRGIQHTIFRWRRTCALTIPRSKCTLMDCIKQRDGQADRVEGGRGRGIGRAREGELDPTGHFQRDARRHAAYEENSFSRKSLERSSFYYIIKCIANNRLNRSIQSRTHRECYYKKYFIKNTFFPFSMPTERSLSI